LGTLGAVHRLTTAAICRQRVSRSLAHRHSRSTRRGRRVSGRLPDTVAVRTCQARSEEMADSHSQHWRN
jgi:hypothetical protein